MNELHELPPTSLPEESTAEGVARVGWSTAFRAAVQFLTRLPVRNDVPFSPELMHRSVIFFPLVGGLIGVITAAVVGAGAIVWPVWIAVLVALVVEARLTGALHEDAVADCCDAFGGGWTRDDVLRILKDSRIGAYGAVGLALALAIRVSAATAIVMEEGLSQFTIWGSAIVAAAAIGRWMMVLAMVCLPPIERRESLSRDFAQRLSGRDLLWSGLSGAPFVVMWVWHQPLHALVALGMLAVGVTWFLAFVRRNLGGTTGDCLGCAGYLAQLLVLLAAAMRFDVWSRLP